MTLDDPHDAPLTPEQDEQVRRALRSVPPAGRTPDEVAERLDAALAALVAERGGVPSTPDAGGANATADLDAARRRRRWRTGLVAAASVAVLGIGLGTVLDDLPRGGAGSDDAATTADGGMAREMAPESPADSAGGVEEGVGGLPPDALLTATPQDLSSATLARDVRRVTALAPAPARVQDTPGGNGTTDPDGGAAKGEGPSTLGDGAAALARCVVPPLLPGDQVAPVTLDGVPATLVVRRAEPGGDGAREAEIYTCDGGDSVLARTVVPGG